ncbi:MAG: putative toxin-antitoxin system toxin component, PIN family [Betaproteobacteria bacterium RBG_19FT_COMBO_58_11]|nr:MAG: putative toxin-antitoxin system toxin component, PIN family [Betaproteobacteria bacterium RBG_19FT_COMBO_58_11]
MRLVLDTNTALSGLLWQGTPGKLIDAAKRQEVELFSSTPLLAELLGVMTRYKFADALAARGLQVQTLFEGYAALVQLVVPAQITRRLPAIQPTMRCWPAHTLDVTVDHLLIGNPVEDSPLANSRLFRRFKMLERLNQDDQDTVIKIIDAIIAKGQVEAALAPVDAAA